MAVDKDLESNLKYLTTALGQIASFHAVRTGDIPVWYGRMLTNILLLTGTSSIRYVTGMVDQTAQSAMAVVFTDDFLVVAEVPDVHSDPEAHTASAVSRSSITRIEVSSSEGVFSKTAFSSWPTDIRMQVSYARFERPITLPLEGVMNGHRMTPLRELLMSLEADMANASIAAQ